MNHKSVEEETCLPDRVDFCKFQNYKSEKKEKLSFVTSLSVLIAALHSVITVLDIVYIMIPVINAGCINNVTLVNVTLEMKGQEIIGVIKGI